MTITLTCPHCEFAKELNVSTLPPDGTRVTCPRCRGIFTLQRGSRPEPEFQPEAVGPGGSPEELESSPPQVATPPAARRTLTFTFTGTAGEYFGIWIVNTLLRIVTLGLYSPWAKVRKRRYFYANTILDDAPFDYLADPRAILRGWFIAGAFFGLYSLASRTSPLLSLGFMLLFFGLFPWVVVRSRIFNLRNSTHRNIRFGFAPDYREAYLVFLWWQLAVPFTMGILGPYVLYLQKRFLVESSSYGTTPFRFHATAKDYYKVFLPLLVLIPLALAAFVGFAWLVPKGGNPMVAVLPAVLFPVVYFVAGVYLPTALANLTWSSTSIGEHRFSCTLRVRDLVWIYFSNAVAILFSLGLLAPWGAVRLARYRLHRLTVTGSGGLDSIMAGAAQEVGAAGEELGDMLGFDVGV